MKTHWGRDEGPESFGIGLQGLSIRTMDGRLISQVRPRDVRRHCEYVRLMGVPLMRPQTFEPIVARSGSDDQVICAKACGLRWA